MITSNPHSDTLRWQVEMACRAAWPALDEVDLGGWVARYSGDAIRRTGSLNPLAGGTGLDASMLGATEAYYRKRSQPVIIRYPDFLPDCAELFAQNAYQPEGDTLTMMAPDIAAVSPSAGHVTIDTSPDVAWRSARARIIIGDQKVFEAMLGRIACPALFASATLEGTIAAIAYGVVVDRLLIIESVATDAAFQGRGLARALVGAMMAKAGAMDARAAALQVVEGNDPALALY